MLSRNGMVFRKILVLKAIIVLFSFLFLSEIALCQKQKTSLSERTLNLTVIKKKDQKNDPWLGEDKLQHLLTSTFMTSFGFLVMRAPLDTSENKSLCLSSGFSFSLGIGKEIYDWRSKKGQASYMDLVADILGIGLAVFIIKII